MNGKMIENEVKEPVVAAVKTDPACAVCAEGVADGDPDTVEKPCAAADPAPDDAALAPWEELLEAYPDCADADKLPHGFFEAVRAGKTPLVAMHEAEINRLKGIIATYEQKEKALKSCGSVTGTAAPEVDPVLEVLLGE